MGIELARVDLDLVIAQRLVGGRDRPELVPVEPVARDVVNVTKVAGPQRRNRDKLIEERLAEVAHTDQWIKFDAHHLPRWGLVERSSFRWRHAE